MCEAHAPVMLWPETMLTVQAAPTGQHRGTAPAHVQPAPTRATQEATIPLGVAPTVEGQLPMAPGIIPEAHGHTAPVVLPAQGAHIAAPGPEDIAGLREATAVLEVQAVLQEVTGAAAAAAALPAASGVAAAGAVPPEEGLAEEGQADAVTSNSLFRNQ